MSTAYESATDTGELVQEEGAVGPVVRGKDGAPESNDVTEAIVTTNVNSLFWAYDDSWRTKGTVSQTFSFPGVTINSASQVSVSVCERGGNGPFMGSAAMSVLNVVPRSGVVDVRWNVAWDSLLPVRLNFIIAN